MCITSTCTFTVLYTFNDILLLADATSNIYLAANYSMHSALARKHAAEIHRRGQSMKLLLSIGKCNLGFNNQSYDICSLLILF